MQRQAPSGNDNAGERKPQQRQARDTSEKKPAPERAQKARKETSKQLKKSTDEAKSEAKSSNEKLEKSARDQSGEKKADKAKSERASKNDGNDSKKQSAKSDDAPSVKSNEGARKSADSGERRAPDEVKKVELNADKKQRVEKAFGRPKADERHADVDINISIGHRLPRAWHYHRVPTAVIEIVPQYRGYVYVYSDDRYVICEPDTYEVVAIIDAPSSSSSRASADDDRCSRNLRLSSDERDEIVESVEDTRRVDVSDLTIGWSVPDSIELHRFPSRVLDQSGELRACRYFVAEDDVAVVDPDEEKVVLLIDND